MTTNSNQPKHTPLPWVATIQGSDTIYIHDKITPNGPSFGTIAEIGGDSNYPDIYKTDKANAEFIVRACNSHYEMLEALKNVMDCYGHLMGKPDIERAEEAIAKAEGRPL